MKLSGRQPCYRWWVAPALPLHHCQQQMQQPPTLLVLLTHSTAAPHY
jgi:hypothetical protein